MPSIELEWDSRDLNVWRSAKVDRALFRALSKAGGDALRGLKTASSRAVRSRKRFKASKVSKGLPLYFPRGKRELKDLMWTMKVSGKPSPLSDFPHRQTDKGVEVMVNVGSSKLVRSAFVATMKSGHTGIFRRRGKSRLPIDEAFTTRISDVFKDDGLIPDVFERAQTVFKSSFDRLFPLELQKIRQ